MSTRLRSLSGVWSPLPFFSVCLCPADSEVKSGVDIGDGSSD